MRTPRMWMALSLAGVLALAGCSAGSDDSGSADEAGMAEDAPAEADPGTDLSAEDSESGTESDSGGETGDDSNLAPADLGDAGGSDDESDANLAAAGRSVITVGTVSVTVEDPFAVAQDIIGDASDAGGWVEGRSYRGATDTEGASATLVLRLPPREVSAAIENLSTYGTVTNLDQAREDVTAQVRDLEARITAMEMSVARVSRFLEEATNRAELLEAEQLLTDRQAQLETLLAQQGALGDQVSMSTLTVELWTPESAPPPPEPDPEPVTGFFSGLQNGWNAFYDFGSDALLVIGALLPWLVFLGLLTVAVYYLAKPIRKWQGSRPPRPARPADPATTLPPAVHRTGPGQPAPTNQASPGHQRPMAAQLLDRPPAVPPPPVSTATSETPPPPPT